jgi:hypothetical protein
VGHTSGLDLAHGLLVGCAYHGSGVSVPTRTGVVG